MTGKSPILISLNIDYVHSKYFFLKKVITEILSSKKASSLCLYYIIKNITKTKKSNVKNKIASIY